MASQSQNNSLENVDDVWPLRLLHVESMESFPRSRNRAGIQYGDMVEPTYNILSYTWGRYRDEENGEAIDVTGPGGYPLSWDIPKVDPERAFDAEAFESVIQTVAGGDEFVWVDVACINQNENAPESAEEIGRQAGIFKRAKKSYIWLHQTTEDQILDSIDLMSQIRDTAKHTRTGVNSHEKYAGKHNRERRIRDEAVIRRLLQDPWFSSLWTLQEAYLKKNAIILSKEGLEIQLEDAPGPGLLTIGFLSNLCTQVNEWIWQTTKDLISTAGLLHLQSHNPLSLLCVSARRTTQRRSDRVYGIMQVFGLRLGNSADGADRGRQFGLEQLEEQLSQNILCSSPALSQLFLNYDKAPKDQSWRLKVGTITQSRRFPRHGAIVPGLDLTTNVPDEFCNSVQTSSRACRISFQGTLPTRPTFEGRIWPLAELKNRWLMEEGLPRNEGLSYTDGPKSPDMNKFTRSLFLDHYAGIEAQGVMPTQFSSYGKPVMIADGIESNYAGELSILILGRIQDKVTGEEAWTGMLARQDDFSLYTRLGFCTWQGEASGARHVTCQLG